MRKLSRLIRPALMAAFFIGPMAVAEEIPEEMLLMDYANCMQGCLEVEGQTACEILCGCSANRFRAELDLDAYNTLMVEMVRDEVSPENRAFLDETGEICVAELDRLMEQYALEEAAETQAEESNEEEGENP